jgi:hypothetical protein
MGAPRIRVNSAGVLVVWHLWAGLGALQFDSDSSSVVNLLFAQRNFEVHQLGAFGVGDAVYVEVGVGEGGGEVGDVEEEESRLGGVRLDGFGGELGGFDLVHFFFADGAFHFFARDGKGQRVGAGIGVGLGIGEAAGDVFGGDGRELGVVDGERDLHIGDGDGLRAVVGDDEEEGEESVLLEVDGEDFGLFGSVVGVGGDGKFVGGVVVVRCVSFCGVSYGLGEVFGGQREGKSCDYAGNYKDAGGQAHGLIIEARADQSIPVQFGSNA